MSNKEKQMDIPGTERPAIKDIDKAADKYKKVRDERMELTKKEVVAKANLLAVAEAHATEMDVDADGNRSYTYDEFQVILTEKRNVKVKKIGDDDLGED